MKCILNSEILYNEGIFSLESLDGKTAVALSPSAGRALTFMIGNVEKECRKKDLIAEIWGKHGFVVGDNSLNQIIVQLRRAFMILDKNRMYIVTIPRVGYKFTAEVAAVGQATESRSTASSTGSVEPSIYRAVRGWLSKLSTPVE